MRLRRQSHLGSHLHAVPSPAARAHVDDAALIEAVQRGDPRLASAFYDRVAGVIDRALCRVFGRREPDHEDLVQIALEQVVLTLSRRRFAGACSLPTWASAIASHVGLDALRSRRRERRVFGRNQPDPEAQELPLAGRGDIERQIGSREELRQVRDELVAMEPKKASVVFLHDVLGHELSEIAVLTSASVAAVQSRLVRGRRDLAARLECARREPPPGVGGKGAMGR